MSISAPTPFLTTAEVRRDLVKVTCVRAMSAKEGNQVLARAGVRFNDWGTFRRANRWNAASWPAQ